MKGIIKVKQKDIIKLVFEKGNLNKLHNYAFKNKKHSTKLLFEKEGEQYIAKIPFNYKRNSVLTL